MVDYASTMVFDMLMLNRWGGHEPHAVSPTSEASRNTLLHTVAMSQAFKKGAQGCSSLSNDL